MSKYYVYSTMSQDVRYPVYGGEQIPVELRSVTIRGGANVIAKNLHTPHGVVTTISEEEHEILKGENSPETSAKKLFAFHEKAGFVKVEKREQKVDKAVGDMESKDKSAQFKAKDFEKMPGAAQLKTDI